MKKTESNLDEMQEQKLLKIEHNGYWLGFWGLLAAILIQSALDPGNIRAMVGEFVVFTLMGAYMVLDCMRNGIWDRKLKPNWQTNLKVSLLAGILFGAYQGVRVYLRLHLLLGAAVTLVISAALIFVLCFGGLQIASALTKRRKQHLEDEE